MKRKRFPASRRSNVLHLRTFRFYVGSSCRLAAGPPRKVRSPLATCIATSRKDTLHGGITSLLRARQVRWKSIRCRGYIQRAESIQNFRVAQVTVLKWDFSVACRQSRMHVLGNTHSGTQPGRRCGLRYFMVGSVET